MKFKEPYWISDKLRSEVLLRDKRTCYYCGKPKLYNRSYALDHLVPTALGGKTTIDNLVVSCKLCNTRKSKSSVQEYAKRRLAELEREKARLVLLVGD
jgi:5-methylcytosine-specific restriction endonuclease McrA